MLLLPLMSRLAMLLSWSYCACGRTAAAAGAIVPKSEQGIPSLSDVNWLQKQVQALKAMAVSNGAWMTARKGINPRSRQQQLFDLRRFHGISHYENGSRSQMECPEELLVEHHHSYYGEPWAGGRDIYEFLATAMSLQPKHRVLEVGCGTLRVGLHFIRFLEPSHYYCLERDAMSLTAAFLYELPANGLLHKRPYLLHGEGFKNATDLLNGPPFDLIYASAVFLHMQDAAVWDSITALGPHLDSPNGRLFVSHNLKFCTRMPERNCDARLRMAGLQYGGKHTHNSLLFNHFEIWYEFKRLGG